MDDLEKTIALMGISESVTLSGPILDTVRAALVRERAQQPVIDAAEEYVEIGGKWSHNELVRAVTAYRAASGSVEADTPAEPDEGGHIPQRDDAVVTWLRKYRDQWAEDATAESALDDLIDEYEERADRGLRLPAPKGDDRD